MKLFTSFAVGALLSLTFVWEANAGCNDSRYGSYRNRNECSPAERQIEGLKADGIEWGRILGNRFANVGVEFAIAPFEDALAISRIRRAVRLHAVSGQLIGGLETQQYMPETGPLGHSSMDPASLGLTRSEAEALRSGRARVVRR